MFSLIISLLIVWRVESFSSFYYNSRSSASNSASTSWGGIYGGNGGGDGRFVCTGSDVIRAIAFRWGNYIDRMSFRCTNGEWTGERFGGSGGGYSHVYASGGGFCGFSGRDSWVLNRVCVTDAAGSQTCFGGSGGSYFSDRTCSQSPGNSRMRLKGFEIRSGAFVDQLQPIWTQMDCENYLTVQQAPHSSWNGNYEFVGWTEGHHRYRKVGDTSKCVYFEYHWKFNSCSSYGRNTAVYVNHIWDDYDYCVHNLGGSSHWEKCQAGSWTNIYPQLAIEGRSSLPLTWGNTVGYWDIISTGQGGDSITYSVTRYTESSTGREFTTEEETSFSSTLEQSHTWGYEMTVGAEFKALSAEAKFSYAFSLTESTTNAIRNNIINSVSHATTSGTETTRECTTTAPNSMHQTWVWTVYRASSEDGNGASQQTCTFQHQTGACRWIPPNCPIGACRDQNCIWCTDGVDPLTPISTLRANYAACFEEIEGRGLRCHPDQGDWSCCSSANPCLAGEGDCDSDADCEGNLVCLEDLDGMGGFDICGHTSTGRRLLQTTTSSEVVVPHDLGEVVEEEAEHEPARGCGQFDDEGHCEAGPLHQFCQWNDVERFCGVKEDVDEADIPDTDFTWIYNL